MSRLGFCFALLLACGDNKKPEIEPFARCETPTFGTTVDLRLVAIVSDTAILVTAPPGDSRLFVIERRGSIRILTRDDRAPDVLFPEPFLDLSTDAGGPVISGFENGLLGLAFHPQYAVNGLFFVTYTAANSGDPDNPQRDVLARCSVSATDPNRADPTSCVEVLSIPDFAANHNGGMIEFGRDGFLYWSTGDGGRGGDPHKNSQALEDGDPMPTTQALLGKILRLDIDHKQAGLEYGIPVDNPFAAGGGKPEIFIRGLRNAWRWSFDRLTGDMWIADVGEARVEELTVLRPSQQPGANLGWSVWEGNECFAGDNSCTVAQVVPQFQRLHSEGWLSIIGGQVYRGTCFPDLQGTYFYTDFDLAGRLVTAKLNDDDTLTIVELPNRFPSSISSIHEDSTGELFATIHDGKIYQLVVTGP